MPAMAFARRAEKPLVNQTSSWLRIHLIWNLATHGFLKWLPPASVTLRKAYRYVFRANP